MSRILVWDATTRLLHCGIAGTLTAALAIGLGVDDDSPLFAYHMLCGLAAGFLVALRIVLGVIGSRYARFSTWVWSPAELVRYAKDVATGRGARHVGHNPGTTWMATGVFVFTGMLIATGIAGGEEFEDVHEVLAYVLGGLIVLHLAGIAVHTIRQRENIAWSMVNGRKEGPTEAGLKRHGGVAAVIWSAVALAGALALFRGYDPAAGRVRVVGLEIPLNAEDERENASEEEGGDD